MSAFVTYSDIQSVLKLEPHMRSAAKCEAPALVCHIAVWPKAGEDPQGTRSVADFNFRIEKWKNSLNRFLAGLSAFGNAAPALRLHSRKGEERIRTFRRSAVDVAMVWRGIPINAQIEIHTDYATFTFVASLGGLDAQPKLDGDNRDCDLREARTGDSDLHARILTFLSQAARRDSGTPAAAPAPGEPADLDASPGMSGETDAEEEDIASFAANQLYEVFWSIFLDEACRNGQSAAGIPGEIFADLRGVVLEPQVDQRTGIWMPRLQRRLSPAQWLRGLAGESQAEPAEVKTFADEAVCHQILKNYEKFVAYQNFKTDQREFVASRVFKNRAIFVSALGAELLAQAAGDSDESAEPGDASDRAIRYLILLADANERQAGRLVELVNTLSTLQAVALKDIDKIREIGTAIRLAGAELDEISREFRTYIQNEEVGRADRRFNDHEEVRRLETRLCDMETRLTEVSSTPVGGLQYRVSRALYYSSRFKTRIEGLDVKPITTWQQYDEFVKRRLYSTFDYLIEVGNRIIKLQARVQTTLEAVEAKALVQISKNIEELNAELNRVYNSQSWQTALLFVIGITAFAGEIFGPVAVHQDLGQYAYQVVAVPPDCMMPAELRHPLPQQQPQPQPQPPGAPVAGAATEPPPSVGALPKSDDSWSNSDNLRCGGAYRLNGYIFGVAISLLLGVVVHALRLLKAGWRQLTRGTVGEWRQRLTAGRDARSSSATAPRPETA
ncbi:MULTISPECIES: DUF3422 family protein [Rhodomicrobium]|uniref:DUF3422 family protein n=1 Tax=Rhodomicrobium TaxID=1068 RepID=UPI000B4C1389|nr:MULTISPECIES: DUF3422 family protein [Rhodomicrobium]